MYQFFSLSPIQYNSYSYPIFQPLVLPFTKLKINFHQFSSSPMLGYVDSGRLDIDILETRQYGIFIFIIFFFNGPKKVLIFYNYLGHELNPPFFLIFDTYHTAEVPSQGVCSFSSISTLIYSFLLLISELNIFFTPHKHFQLTSPFK